MDDFILCLDENLCVKKKRNEQHRHMLDPVEAVLWGDVTIITIINIFHVYKSHFHRHICHDQHFVYLPRKTIRISDRKEKRQDSPIEETKMCSKHNQRGGGGWRCKQVHLRMQAGTQKFLNTAVDTLVKFKVVLNRGSGGG